MSRTPEDLTALESALASLAPSAPALNRDQLLFEAGRSAAPRRLHWPLLTTAFAGLSAVLGVQLMTRAEPATRIVEVVVHQPAPVPVPKVEVVEPATTTPNASKWGHSFHSSSGYLSRRDRALHFGQDSLPAPSPVPAGTSDSPKDLKSWYESLQSS